MTTHPQLDHENKTVKLSLRGGEIMDELNRREREFADRFEGCSWVPEWGSWLVARCITSIARTPIMIATAVEGVEVAVLLLNETESSDYLSGPFFPPLVMI